MFFWGPPNIEKLKQGKKLKRLAKALVYKKNADIRAQAATALGDLGDGSVIEALTEASQHGDNETKTAAAKALNKIGGTPALLGALQDEYCKCYSSVASELGVEKLLVCLEDEGQASELRQSAAEGLGKLKDQSCVERLGKFIFDSNWHLREATCYALGYIRGESAVELLKKASMSNGYAAAIAGLSMIGTGSARQALREASEKGDAAIRSAAKWALVKDDDYY